MYSKQQFHKKLLIKVSILIKKLIEIDNNFSCKRTVHFITYIKKLIYYDWVNKHDRHTDKPIKETLKNQNKTKNKFKLVIIFSLYRYCKGL